MGSRFPRIAYLALALALAPAVARTAETASTQDDVARLRAELAQLKSDYAERVGRLEARIDELAAAAATPPPAAEPVAPPATPARSASAFNPAISAILAGNYANLSEDPGTYHYAGFMPSGGEVGPGERGFNLGESEITFAASVDPYFTASLTAALSPENEIGVEEAFFRTTGLPSGFSVKGGRFFAGVGYLNEIHAHAWDFVDQPLAYQALFGGQLAQDGLQLKWLAPTDVFVEFGAELGNGDAFPGTRRNRNGFGSTALFAHTGSDLGESASWRAGVSWLDHDAEDRSYEDADRFGTPVTNAFTGQSRTWIADATLKWVPARGRMLKLQAEYLRRTEDGTLAFDVDGANLEDVYHSTQSGWYVQGVYQFRPRWRAGLRYDSLDSGTPYIALVDGEELLPADFPALLPGSPRRATLMLDWSPSEFSRLRAQYAWDDARDADTDRQLHIEYIYAIGAHGAHKF